MNANETSGQETDEPTRPAHRNELAAAADEQTLKRARWEHLRLAACPGTGRVNVCNLSYGVHEKADHTYTVTVERGEPTDCTCPAATYQSGPCKHVVAVAADREVLDEAMHGDSEPSTDDDANQAVVTDGGRDPDPETCEQCGREGVEHYVCAECAEAADERRDDDVSGTERADFGGGESSGVDEL